MADPARSNVLRDGPGPNPAAEKPRWSRRLSLTSRILFVNVLPLVLLGGGVIYLDFYRKQLLDERFKLALVEAQITAEALAGATDARQEALLIQIGKEQRLRIRLYDADGELEGDSFALSAPTFSIDAVPEDNRDFALTLDLSENTDPVVIARRLAALRTEYAFWTKGERCATKGSPCERVVVMPDGSILNRYWDGRDTPRDESFAEDRATAAEVEGEPAEKVYRNLRAAAESGWDFSSRWFADGQTLATIRTTDIVPVDLNSLLYAMEMRIARGCREAGDQACADGLIGAGSKTGQSPD